MSAVSVTINNSDGTFRKLEGAPAAVAEEVFRLLREGQATTPTVNMPPDANIKSTRYEPVQPAPQTLAGFGNMGGSLVPTYLPPPPSTAAPLPAKRAGRGGARQPQQHAPQPVATRPPHAQQPLQTLSTAEPIEGWPGQVFGGKAGEGLDRSLQAMNPATRSAVASQPLHLPPSSFEA